MRELPEATLTMVGPDKGDGSLDRLVELADRLGVSERLKLTGLVEKSRVPELLDESVVFLNTATIDNAPLSLMEAAACGLCIVTTNVGGIRHLWSDGKDAVLVPAGDVAAMAGGVLRVLRDREFAERISAAARRKAEALDWSETLPRWEELFTRVAAEHRR
jgi:glycosyltransferase involved in cell wall biosynthesis